METITKSTENLTDLIQINNDRIEGYEHALRELKPEDRDLKSLFTSMIDESRKIRMALAKEVEVMGGESNQGTTTSGKIYRAWMDVKAVFTGHDRHTVLANCEAGEDAAQKAYSSALRSNELPGYIRDMLTGQQLTLRQSHDKVKALRDSSKTS